MIRYLGTSTILGHLHKALRPSPAVVSSTMYVLRAGQIVRQSARPVLMGVVARHRSGLISPKFLRFSSDSSSDDKPSVPPSSTPQTNKNNQHQLRMDKPAYQLTFTCKKCSTRSSHNVSKQAYHSGTVLIQCPGCKARHLIADHLRIFSDKSITLEDILATKGEGLTKGTIDLPTEDLEWEEMPKSLADKANSTSEPSK